MKGEWRVSSNFVGGETLYGVYCLRDTQAVDHSGNRECRGYYDVKADAQKEADRLNREENND
ncbi:hypothetical protein [Emergencia sp.]|uniref:hypothetical protein n=1 Tax=Emergencia sp. TaxID=1926557 RepID=UPI003AF02443